jgi:Na+/glutamate symporter
MQYKTFILFLILIGIGSYVTLVVSGKMNLNPIVQLPLAQQHLAYAILNIVIPLFVLFLFLGIIVKVMLK